MTRFIKFRLPIECFLDVPFRNAFIRDTIGDAKCSDGCYPVVKEIRFMHESPYVKFIIFYSEEPINLIEYYE
jgi:hypothetical protein